MAANKVNRVTYDLIEGLLNGTEVPADDAFMQTAQGLVNNNRGNLQNYLSSAEVVDTNPAPAQPVAGASPSGGSFSDQVNGIWQQIVNREPFSYDFNADPIYKQYANQYTKLGQQAAKDVSARAAALSGGYGNSYGTSAAAQAYNEYMDKLNNVVPTLEGQAYERWRNEGNDLYTKLNAARGLAGDEAEAAAAAYEQYWKEREYEDKRSDALWEQAFKETQFNWNVAKDERDHEYKAAQDEIANMLKAQAQEHDMQMDWAKLQNDVDQFSEKMALEWSKYNLNEAEVKEKVEEFWAELEYKYWAKQNTGSSSGGGSNNSNSNSNNNSNNKLSTATYNAYVGECSELIRLESLAHPDEPNTWEAQAQLHLAVLVNNGDITVAQANDIIKDAKAQSSKQNKNYTDWAYDYLNYNPSGSDARAAVNAANKNK